MRHLPFEGERFSVEQCPAFLIQSERHVAAGPAKWVWYAPALPAHPGEEERWMFEQFLSHGISIAGIDIGESFGSPTGVDRFNALYRYLTVDRQMDAKPALLARSRGGLMLYNWAGQSPDSTSCIAGIYPVCNLASYPGLDKAVGAYGLSAEAIADRLPQFNPIDGLAPLAEAGVPIFHIHGDNDDVVPLEANSAMVADRYKALGGDMTLEIIPDGGHDLNTHWFQSQALVDFVITNLLA